MPSLHDIVTEIGNMNPKIISNINSKNINYLASNKWNSRSMAIEIFVYGNQHFILYPCQKLNPGEKAYQYKAEPENLQSRVKRKKIMKSNKERRDVNNVKKA